jgi:hypothetical protein
VPYTTTTEPLPQRLAESVCPILVPGSAAYSTKPRNRVRLFARLVAFSLAATLTACNPRPTTFDKERVNAALLAVPDQKPLVIADALETLIAVGKDSKEDRRFAYFAVSQKPVTTAADAFARAAVAGRLAQASGLSASALVAEVEQYAASSMQMDPNFRQGAAQRSLGTLYVLAPAMLLKHGDSERGLALLEDLARKWPRDPETRLRLAEAYIALNDPEPAYPHLCFCLAHRQEITPDDQQLLARLLEDAKEAKCP